MGAIAAVLVALALSNAWTLAAPVASLFAGGILFRIARRDRSRLGQWIGAGTVVVAGLVLIVRILFLRLH